MIRFILARVAYGLVVVFLSVSVVFFLLRLTGDPVLIYAPMDSTEEQLQEIREDFGLDDPLYQQYVQYMQNALQGNFGESIRFNRSALSVVAQQIPATAELAVVAFAFSVALGLPLGIVAAIKHRTKWDRGVSAIASLGQSVPNFWLGLILILFLSIRYQILPTSGRGGIEHLVMPAVSLAMLGVARYARMARSSMLDVLSQDYIRTARSKGLGERVVILRHAFRNASSPLITISAFEVTRLLGGAVVIEQLFAWPGVGRITVQALLARDFPVVAVSVIFLSVVTVVANIVSDVAYAVNDPRIRMR